MSFNRIFCTAARISVGAVALASGLAHAQEVPDTSPDRADADEIVVTGTLIRGSEVVGSPTIAVGQEKIEAIGATTTADLIANLPQTGQFLGFVGVRGSSNFSLTVNRPSLRFLGGGSGSSAPTLLLLDGHRLPGMGITQSSPDLDAISPGAIERVEVVPDGGSATYGSDAIGGVMNFITRRKFDGVEVRGNVGFAEDYMQWNAGITAGVVGSSVSAYLAYDYSYHDELYGRDRDWSQSRDWVNGVGSSRNCNVGSLSAGGVFYALPGVVAGLGNRCDPTEEQTIYPREKKHSVFGRVVFEPGGPFSFDVSAYYVNRKNFSNGLPLAPTGLTVRPTTPGAAPFFAQLPAGTASATLLRDLSAALGTYVPQNTQLEAYGITPTIKFDAGAGWQINAMMNYGVGNSTFLGQLFNVTPLQNAITAGNYNPFTLTALNGIVDPLTAASGQALDSYIYGRAKHQMMNGRVVADGPLLDLPAGALRVAVGAEYYWERYNGVNNRSITAAGIAALVDRVGDRTVKSAFGELSIPIFGEGSGPFHKLTVTAAARYDDYSDFGSTFNPKFGVNFEPFLGLRLRGNWGKSFQAPGISDLALAGAPLFSTLPLSSQPYFDPNNPPPASRPVVLTLGGTITPLKPQTATTWSLGFDFEPTGLPGFAAGVTYYNIDYRDQIGLPPIFTPTTYYRDFTDKYVIYTQGGNAALQAQFDKLAAQGASNAPQTIANLPNGFADVYGVLDARVQNLARTKTSGLDFYVRYNHDTGFGSIYADVGGNYILTFRQQSNPSAALVDLLTQDMSRLKTTATLGATVGDSLRGQIVWNHSQGYAITPTTANLQQNRIGSYNVFNLFLQYKLTQDSGIAKDLAFTLNVDNLFDQDPPLFRGGANSLFGVANGFTLGRLVKFGVTKKF